MGGVCFERRADSDRTSVRAHRLARFWLADKHAQKVVSACSAGLRLIPLSANAHGTRKWVLVRKELEDSEPHSAGSCHGPRPVHLNRQKPWRTSYGAVQSQQGGPADSAGIRMTTLDQQLYAWLAEADERRFERAFNAYFSVAFPAVVRRLSRLSHWDLAQLEELAQDTLLRFFEKVGRSRREASEAIRTALEGIRPLKLGPFHERQVNAWLKEVASFRDKVMGFRLGPIDESNDAEWKGAIHALAERVPPLQRQGCHLLHSVQLELRWNIEDEDSVERTARALEEPSIIVSLAEILEVDNETNTPVPMAVIERFAREVIARTTQALAIEERYPGVIPFVEGTYSVISAIPLLRVPTNGYLFQIAMTIYLDECKKRGRQKRGGSGTQVSEEVSAAVATEVGLRHPVEVMTLDSGPEFEIEEGLDHGLFRPAKDNFGTALAMPAIDPTRQYEDEEFLEKFYVYLRKPVDEATEAYRRAQATGRGIAERRRLESLTNKFARMTSVLSMMGEGYTQEGTAEQLGISRNQVKYIIELAQEAYARFAAEFTQALPQCLNVGGQPHAT
jgi:DNA-directed RNA polymerase specialized sigma24 family protein